MEKTLTETIDRLEAKVRDLLKILRKQSKDIHKNCVQCSGEVDAVESCPVKKCPLYKWREGK